MTLLLSCELVKVPEPVLRTVRASVSTKHEFSEKRVKIGVLVVGQQEGFVHIRHVRTANYIFSQNDQVEGQILQDPYLKLFFRL